jgi:hypothetical protein
VNILTTDISSCRGVIAAALVADVEESLIEVDRTTASVKPSQVTLKECAFVRGTSTDKGITVLATNVNLSQPANGTCNTQQRTGTPRAPS